MSKSPKLLKILVIGIGGGGSNMISHLLSFNYTQISHAIVNTDAQVLYHKDNLHTIQIGKELTSGLGAGMKPEVGLLSAKESHKELENLVNGNDIIFISAGMGGGTGTGAAPYIAELSKSLGILTIGVLTKPFKFESKKRMKIANIGIEKFESNCDSLILIENDNLFKIIDKKSGIKDSFKKVDNILVSAIKGVINSILSVSENDINIDLADLNTILINGGLSVIGSSDSIGIDSANTAVQKVLESPLLSTSDISGSKGILVHFTINENFPFLDIAESMNIFEDLANEDANIIFGTTNDNSLKDTEIRVTMIATGFYSKSHMIKNKTIEIDSHNKVNSNINFNQLRRNIL